jgi:hypothetical protein
MTPVNFKAKLDSIFYTLPKLAASTLLAGLLADT